MLFSNINNRELATCIWICGFVIFCLFVPSIRKSIPGLLKALLSRQILIPILLMIAYVITAIYALYEIRFWDTVLLKTSIAWFIGVGFVMFFKANNAIKNPYHIKKIIKDNIKLTIIMEFILNFYVFSLPVELLLLPSITILVLLKLVSERDKKYHIVTKLISSTLSILGLTLIVYVSYKLISNFKEFVSLENLKYFLFPVLMTFIYIPFLYILVLYMIYQEFFVRINWTYKQNELLRKYTKRRVFEICRFNLSRTRVLTKELHIFNINSKEELEEAIVEINNTFS